MSQEESKRCKELCAGYLLSGRPNLKRVLLLLDARHGIKLSDINYFKELIFGGDATDVLPEGENTGTIHKSCSKPAFN